MDSRTTFLLPGLAGLLLTANDGFYLSSVSPLDSRGIRGSAPKSIPQAERDRRKRKEKIAAKSRKRNRR